MPLQIEPIPVFETNYIWAIHDGRHCALVDPGSAPEAQAFLAERNLRLSALLLTHHHADHIGGVDQLLERNEVPVWGPEDERIPQVTHHIREQGIARVPALDLALTVLETPGHTRSHIVYYNDELLLAGDTLFSAGCGRLFEGDAEQMQASLDKLSAVPDTARLYCAHEYTESNCRFALMVEPDNTALQAWAKEVRQRRASDQITLPTTLDLERRINPFLRTRQPAVISAAQHRNPGCSARPGDVLATIRSWKDAF